jgi:hypothetical protein
VLGVKWKLDQACLLAGWELPVDMNQESEADIEFLLPKHLLWADQWWYKPVWQFDTEGQLWVQDWAQH